jgi:uncharacterized protein YjgD (DUF1641 family)
MERTEIFVRSIDIKGIKMTESQKLDFIIKQNEEIISVLATLIRTLDRKGIIDQSTFSGCTAVGKSLAVRKLVFGVGKK